MRLFCKAPVDAGSGVPKVYERPRTEAAVALTDEEREEVESFYDQIHSMGPESRRPFVMGRRSDEIAGSWSAMALQQRAERLTRTLDLGMYHCNEDRLHLTDQILSAATKAYAIFPIPIHLYDVGCAMELAGLYDDARQCFADFLRSQSQFEPDETAETVESRRDLRSAISHASSRVAGYRVAA